MGATATMESTSFAQKKAIATDHRSTANLPLAMANEGDTVVVQRIHGATEMRQHLNELGFVEGAEVKIISRSAGDVVVSVKGARIGLNRAMSMKITVA